MDVNCSLLTAHSTWMEEGCRGGRLRGTLNHRKSANLPVHLLVNYSLLITGDRRQATGYSAGLLISQARRTLIQVEAAEILSLNTVTGMDGTIIKLFLHCHRLSITV